MKRKQDGQSGFTLVEMLVTMALLGLALAISIPYVAKSGQGQMLDATAAQLASLFRSAQTQSYVSNLMVDVTFDRDKRTWTIARGAAPLRFDDSIKVTALTIAEAVSEKRVSYRFFPEGGNSGGRVLLEANSAATEISLHWLTGAVSTKRVR